MQINAEQWMHVLFRETERKKVWLVIAFVVISLSLLATGILFPKRYKSSVTIAIGDKNIIEPLMEGAAVQTDVAARGLNAREIIFSKRIMHEILEHGNWDLSSLRPVEIVTLKENIMKNVRVENVSRNLLKISYRDADPERTYRITKKFGELFIRESIESKRNESQEAFDFISAQVDQYHKKLLDAEQRLKEFRRSKPYARPGSQSAIEALISDLKRQISQTKLLLSEERERKKTLLQQLSGEDAYSEQMGREEQIRSRIAELNNQKENLLLNYYESHPDVVSLNHQIDELYRLLEQERLRQSTVTTSESKHLRRSALYDDLRRQLAVSETRIATLITRLNLYEKSLAKEQERSIKVANSEAHLAELTREYEVNRDIYRDLMRRRENARVSMNLDTEGQGLSFNIQEPAFLPVKPHGLRLLHFALAGIALGILVPLGALVFFIHIDPKVRLQSVIKNDLQLRVLSTIPTLYTPAERIASKTVGIILGIIILGVFVIYGYIGYLQFTHAMPKIGLIN